MRLWKKPWVQEQVWLSKWTASTTAGSEGISHILSTTPTNGTRHRRHRGPFALAHLLLLNSSDPYSYHHDDGFYFAWFTTFHSFALFAWFVFRGFRVFRSFGVFALFRFFLLCRGCRLHLCASA